MARNPRASTKTQDIAMARRLLRGRRSAVLSSHSVGDDGWAYGSLVTVATDVDGSPLMLFSQLSDHTRNLAKDSRASLLFEQASGRRNPQTGPRISVLGRIKKTNNERHSRRFLARHPEAEHYAGFGDFNFYRMAAERIHLIGGFAQARWLRARDVLADKTAAKMIAEAEPGILAHMNADHADAIDLYAKNLLGRRGRGWRMSAIDPDGADLTLDGRMARLPFQAPLVDAGACRDELVRLVAEARKRAKKSPNT